MNGIWQWLKRLLFTGNEIKPGHEPSFNFEPPDPEIPPIPLEPERPGQPRIKGK